MNFLQWFSASGYSGMWFSALGGGNILQGALRGAAWGGVSGGLAGLGQHLAFSGAMGNIDNWMAGGDEYAWTNNIPEGAVVVKGKRNLIVSTINNALVSTINSFTHFGTSLFSIMGNAASMMIHEGIHEGSPYNRKNTPFRTYTFEKDWSFKKKNQYYGHSDRGLSTDVLSETVTSTTDILLTVTPIRPQLNISSPLVNEVGSRAVDMGTKTIIKQVRDKYVLKR